MQEKWYCRWAPSLGGGFAGTPEECWGVEKYNPDLHLNENVVFCGLYGLPDFYALWKHKGRKAIWWAGSDIRHFINGYWLDDKGEIRFAPRSLAEWIIKNCESWVENKAEYDALKKFGIKSKMVPSFLGDVNKFKPQKLNKELRYYSSVSGNDFKLYGWDKINKIAKKNPHITYYLYGNTIPWKAPKNVIVRGRMSQNEMDEEIKTMTGAICMVKFSGASEIVIKSILYGQTPITLIEYPYDRNKLLRIVNRYPWNLNVSKMPKLSKRVYYLSKPNKKREK